MTWQITEHSMELRFGLFQPWISVCYIEYYDLIFNAQFRIVLPKNSVEVTLFPFSVTTAGNLN